MKLKKLMAGLCLVTSFAFGVHAADISQLNVNSNTYSGTAETTADSSQAWDSTVKPTGTSGGKANLVWSGSTSNAYYQDTGLFLVRTKYGSAWYANMILIPDANGMYVMPNHHTWDDAYVKYDNGHWIADRGLVVKQIYKYSPE